MRSKRVSILVIGLTVLGLTAGVLAGLLVARLPGSVHPIPTGPGGLPTPLVEELGLNSDQQQQMRSIWEGVRGEVQESFQRAQDLQKQRDAEIAAMMTDEQKAKFEKLAGDYTDRYEKITQKRELTFQEAVEKTKNLLDPGQKKKYEELLRIRLGRPPATMPGTPL